MMKLFDDAERYYQGPAGFGEPEFIYLNRSAIPKVIRIREVLEAWFAVFLHHDILVTVVPFLYYLVAGASAYAIARVLGLGRTLSATAATLYLFTPSLAIQATACKNDIAIAAVYLLAIAVLLDLLRNVGHGDRRALGRRIAVVGMALCLGLGTKPYLAVIFPAPLLIGLLAVLKQRSRGYRLFKFEARRPASTALLCVFLILACALLGFYWYGRNWVLFDNDVMPYITYYSMWIVS